MNIFFPSALLRSEKMWKEQQEVSSDLNQVYV